MNSKHAKPKTQTGNNKVQQFGKNKSKQDAPHQKQQNRETKIRVVTYNLLTEQFFTKEKYPTVDESCIDPTNRWNLIHAKLTAQMNIQGNSEQQSTKPHPIFCFQEVTQTMNSHLAVFFQQKNYFYHFVPYEGHSSGYMGVAIAFPAFVYCLEMMRIFNLANTKRWSRPPSSSPPASTPSSPLTTDDIDGGDDNDNDDDDGVGSDDSQRSREDDSEGSESGRSDDDDSNNEEDEDGVWDLTLIDKADHEFENERRKKYWSKAQMKQNKMLFLKLAPRTSKDSPFCIATYHMPATYQIPEVMLIHAKLLKNQVAKLARSDPYIIAGDFNFEPSSSCYSLFTTCTLPPHHLPNLPLPVEGVDENFKIIGDDDDGNEEDENQQRDEMNRPRNNNNHKSSAVSLCSAYMAVNGEEPKFTNYAHPSDRNMHGFQGTLDYLFYNPEKCRAIEVLPIPDLDQPIPSTEEPSDHVMIGATFILTS